MQKFDFKGIDKIQKELESYQDIVSKMTKEMLQEAANEVYRKVCSETRSVFKKDGDKIANNVIITKVYDTPSDGAVNIQVGYSGYFYNRYGKKTPAPLVANVMEYGSTTHKKHPYFRKCFRSAEITKIMEEVQKRYLPKE